MPSVLDPQAAWDLVRFVAFLFASAAGAALLAVKVVVVVAVVDGYVVS